MADRKASSLASSVGDQLVDLKDTVAELSERVSEIAAARAADARKRARAAAKTVTSSGLYDDGLDALQSAGDKALYYGRRAGAVVKGNPGLSLLGVALAAGAVAAIIWASREDDRRWYERSRRGGWF